MPDVQVVSFAHIQEVEDKVGHAAYEDGQRRAHADFERTAAELAGDDQTLRRVLLARLKDAHTRGYLLAHEEQSARDRARVDLPVARYFE